jgi:phytanoyl-CoA hydroxylase
MNRFIASSDGRLSPQQQNAFAKDGILILENYMAPLAPQALQRRILDLIDSKREQLLKQTINPDNSIHIPPLSFFFESQALNANKQLCYPIEKALHKISPTLHRDDPVFNLFSYQKKILTSLKNLGYITPLIIQSMYHFKSPQISHPVEGHQDATFIHSSPKPVIGLWFALETATQENGCLWALIGQHHLPLRNKFLRQENGQLEFEFYSQEPWLPQEAVPIEVPAGSLVILHGHLPHGSFANRSCHSRQAYTLHAIDALDEYLKTNWLHPSHTR